MPALTAEQVRFDLSHGARWMPGSCAGFGRLSTRSVAALACCQACAIQYIVDAQRRPSTQRVRTLNFVRPATAQARATVSKPSLQSASWRKQLRLEADGT